jgi:hypothetical protein
VAKTDPVIAVGQGAAISPLALSRPIRPGRAALLPRRTLLRSLATSGIVAEQASAPDRRRGPLHCSTRPPAAAIQRARSGGRIVALLGAYDRMELEVFATPDTSKAAALADRSLFSFVADGVDPASTRRSSRTVFGLCR